MGDSFHLKRTSHSNTTWVNIEMINIAPITSKIHVVVVLVFQGYFILLCGFFDSLWESEIVLHKSEFTPLAE